MRATHGYATHGPDSRLEPFSFERRDPGPDDVLIQILYCGICHADIHHARNDWQTANYPMVPGHEIIGRVGGVGSNVASFKEGDLAGVGCFVDSCRECESCGHGMEQYCSGPAVWTYNTVERAVKRGPSADIHPRSSWITTTCSACRQVWILQQPLPCCARVSRPTHRLNTSGFLQATALASSGSADWVTWRSSWQRPWAPTSQC